MECSAPEWNPSAVRFGAGTLRLRGQTWPYALISILSMVSFAPQSQSCVIAMQKLGGLKTENALSLNLSGKGFQILVCTWLSCMRAESMSLCEITRLISSPNTYNNAMCIVESESDEKRIKVTPRQVGKLSGQRVLE